MEPELRWCTPSVLAHRGGSWSPTSTTSQLISVCSAVPLPVGRREFRALLSCGAPVLRVRPPARTAEQLHGPVSWTCSPAPATSYSGSSSFWLSARPVTARSSCSICIHQPLRICLLHKHACLILIQELYFKELRPREKHRVPRSD